MNKLIVTLIAMGLVFALLPAMGGAEVPTITYTENWDGRGTDSKHCEYAGQEGRPATGWIHWVFSTKGESTDAELILGGTGSGTYAPGNPPNANIWHFYTPYFDLNGLTATINLYGGAPGSGGGLVISDYCPGENGGIAGMLQVTKTVETSYNRTHSWSIDKSVDTDNGFTHEGYPKIWLYTDGSGDENATWTVDVAYEGYTDSDFIVKGNINITNIDDDQTLWIQSIEDVLGNDTVNMIIPVFEGVTFPYELGPGESLNGTYCQSLDSKMMGENNVTVIFSDVEVPDEVVETLSDNVPIDWGDPENEFYKTVTVKDISDIFGEVALGTATAPNNAQFTYTKDFAWADYGKDNCGDFSYDNTATIVETGQEASATLKVNVQCYNYETAYAKGDDAICFIPTFANWGWTNPIVPGEYTWDLWAAAGQCDTSKGTLVGTVTVVYDDDGYVTVTYNVGSPYLLEETHVYAGTTMFPKVKQGKNTVFTVAPGLYTNNGPFDGSQVYVIAHAVVGIPDPNFGPA
ncbi:MAG: hypothetical protein H5T43_01980 [Methanomethylovorans sp.]|nr:hypothetical protein [Methanomethylovorans sp.]